MLKIGDNEMINENHAKEYCKDYTKIENYDLAMSDTTQTWECHHRNERFYTRQELIDLGLYYDCPSCELIFLTMREHRKQDHKSRKNRIFSAESKKKISESHKNKKLSNETKKKMSEAAMGKHWYNNGIKQTLAYECPYGFFPGRL